MLTGTVAWWDKRNGSGRIRADKGGGTYPFDRARVRADSQSHTFSRGERVGFYGDRTADGLQAFEVHPLPIP